MRIEAGQPGVLTDLRKRISDVERCGADARREHARPSPTGWAPLDAHLPGGGLRFGATHEFIGLCAPGVPGSPGATGTPSHRWTPALGVLLHLAAQAAALSVWIVWIGRRVWVAPHALARAGVLTRSLFVDAPDGASRLWAADTALRCAGLVVVADAASFTLPASRRLQLAAESGASVGLLARPQRDADRLSAAATRWRVSALPATEHQRWTIELLRCKGPLALRPGTGRCVVERLHDGLRVPVPERVGERPLPAASAS